MPRNGRSDSSPSGPSDSKRDIQGIQRDRSPSPLRKIESTSGSVPSGDQIIASKLDRLAALSRQPEGTNLPGVPSSTWENIPMVDEPVTVSDSRFKIRDDLARDRVTTEDKWEKMTLNYMQQLFTWDHELINKATQDLKEIGQIYSSNKLKLDNARSAIGEDTYREQELILL
jgi:hypothetical protein